MYLFIKYVHASFLFWVDEQYFYTSKMTELPKMIFNKFSKLFWRIR